jgi:hypothetical protein
MVMTLSAYLALAQAPARAADPNYKAGGIILQSSGGTTLVSAPAAATGPTGVQIAQVQLTSQVAFGRPVDSVTSFAPNQPAIFAWFHYAGAQPGSTLTGRLIFLAPAGEIEALTATMPLAKTEDMGSLRFNMPPEMWPEGRYRLDLMTDGTTRGSIQFDVRRRP